MRVTARVETAEPEQHPGDQGIAQQVEADISMIGARDVSLERAM